MEPCEARQMLAVFVVNSSLDLIDSFPDDGICDTANDPLADPPVPPSGICTLRAALRAANDTPDDDEIRFAIPGVGVPIIMGALGGVGNGAVDIDGTTQPGGMVEIRAGITLAGDGHTVRGLVFGEGELTIIGAGATVVGNYFGTDSTGAELGAGPSGLNIRGDSARIGGVAARDRNIFAASLELDGDNHHVHNNYIGVDITGEIALRGLGLGGVGVVIRNSTSSEIGGDSPDKGNVIVGNSVLGAIRFEITGQNTSSGHVISHNYIGTNKDGTQALGNIGGGIQLRNTVDTGILDNVIAAGRPAEGLPGSGTGVVLGGGTQRVLIQGNLIGTNAAGTVVDPDGAPSTGDEFGHESCAVCVIGNGVSDVTTVDNTIGGTGPLEANVIAGSGIGVAISAGAKGTTVLGNYIGTDAAGAFALPNGAGVVITHAQHNVIGGNARNIIAGNRTAGIQIGGDSAVDNLVANNFIGTNAAGSAALPNGIGVEINGAPGNCVGGVVPVDHSAPSFCARSPVPGTGLMGNLISGNDRYGVHIFNAQADGNLVQSNRIGVNAAGTSAIGNGWDGVAIEEGADSNMIGGTSVGRGNLISGNLGDGILIVGTPTDFAADNQIAGNWIGTDVFGEMELENGGRGIHLDHDVFRTTIGGQTGASRNVVSGNRLDGIIIAFNSTLGNVIINNYVGTDKDGESAIPNKRHGILLLDSPENTLGLVDGSDGFGNVISGNLLSGVRIQGASAVDNVVAANAIGVNAARSERLANGEHGVHIVDAGGNVIGGQFSGDPALSTFNGNILSGNQGSGLRIEGTSADRNYVGANLIGANGAGTGSLFNGSSGIHVLHASQTRIGAALAGEPALSGNIITSNLNGILIEGVEAVGTLVGGNLIGVDWRGQTSSPPSLLGNTAGGVRIVDASETHVGGLYFADGQTTVLAANVIAANGVGVQILGDAAQSNRIQRNRIFGNLDLGIDLGADGLTPNDDDAALTGPNRRQNTPVDLQYREFDSALIGKLVSRPLETFTIDLYENPSADAAGSAQGREWVKTLEVTTDANGEVEFAIPVSVNAGMAAFTATATDAAGNTSEFSGPLRQADLEVATISLFPSQVRKTSQGYVLPLSITVRNLGTGPATNAQFQVTGNGQPLDASTSVDLEPGESQELTGTWLLNSLLQAEPRGVALLDLIVRADPDNLIPELPIGVNLRTASMTADARPVIVDLKKQFAEGLFLQNVPLDNQLEVFVDWNGNLDGVVFSADDLPEFNFQLNAVPRLPDGGLVSVAADEPTRFTLGMHDDLALGKNLILVEARNRLQNFTSSPVYVRYDQVAAVSFIEAPLWTVEGNGGPYEQTAEYTSKIFLPQLATGGFINVPVDRLGVSGGAFGPELPQAAVTTVLRSNRTSSLEGEFLMEGDLADEDLGGVGASISATVHGEFTYEPNLHLASLSGTLRGDVSVKGPKVPLPPVPWIRAQASFGLGVDATLSWTENEAGQLELNPDVVLGLEPSGEFALSVMLKGVGVEVAGGANLRGEFSLAQNPCLFLGGKGELFVRVTASAWIFEASKTIPVAEVALPGCGAGAVGDGEQLVAPHLTTWGVLPRFTGAESDVEGESSGSSLPSVLFPYAKPALAQHSDGTMTLVYVNEDPLKATGQQLEVFAVHFDGAQWSAPIQISDDLLLDDAPSVAYDSEGQAIAVWSRIKTAVENPEGVDPQSLVPQLEIVWSRRDSTTGTWSAPQALTDNLEMDHLPQVSRGADGQVMAVWTHAAGDNWPLFPDDDSRSLTADFHFSSWDGASWSTPAIAVSGASSATAPELALGSGEGFLAWSEDEDGDVTTDTDTSIRLARWNGVAWLPPESLGGAADGIADLNPQVSFGPDDTAVVAWVRAGAPVPGDEDDFADELAVVDFLGGAFSAPETIGVLDNANELKLVRDLNGSEYFVWGGLSDTGPDVFAARRDAITGQLAAPAALTDSESLEWMLRPFFNSAGELEVIYLDRALGSETVVVGAAPSEGDGEPGPSFVVPTFLQSSFASITHSTRANLTVESLELSDPNPEPGTVVNVTVVVRNTGLEAADAFEVRLFDDGAPVGDALLIPILLGGQQASRTFAWTAPIGATAPHTLLVRADVGEVITESSEADNEFSRVVLKPDLSVENVFATREGDALIVGARLYNRAATTIQTAQIVELRLDQAPTGTLLGVAEFDQPLAHNAWVDVRFTINDPLGQLEKVRTARFRADAANLLDEFNEQNNSADVLLSPFGSWSNDRNPLDVNYDSFVTPVDALIVINELNNNGSGLLPVPAYPPAFLDVSNDLLVAPLDALLVINFLNGVGTLEGETALTLLDTPSTPLPVVAEKPAPWIDVRTVSELDEQQAEREVHGHAARAPFVPQADSPSARDRRLATDHVISRRQAHRETTFDEDWIGDLGDDLLATLARDRRQTAD